MVSDLETNVGIEHMRIVIVNDVRSVIGNKVR